MFNDLLQIKRVQKFIFISGFASLSACSSVDNALDTTTAVNYTNNASVAVLKLPEGISSPEYDMTLALPENSQNNKSPATVDIRPPGL